MRIRLGYVAICKTLDKISYNHTITYTHYQKLSESERLLRLDSIIKKNLEHLFLILQYNVLNHISFFRFSHNLIPLATHQEVSFDYITPYLEMWEKIGRYIKENQMRIDSHPDQFCVLNSIHESVFDQSVQMLTFQYELYKAMGIKGKVILHVGSSAPNKDDALKRFVSHFRLLPSHIQDMILLENDDKTFTVNETLSLCEMLGIPMVLDFHHYRCNPGNDDIHVLLPRILKTWEDSGLPVKMHFSSPKSRKEKRSHSVTIDVKQFISFLEILKPYQTDIDIMLECKGKDESLFRLSRQLRFYTDYSFLNETTFEILE